MREKKRGGGAKEVSFGDKFWKAICFERVPIQ